MTISIRLEDIETYIDRWMDRLVDKLMNGWIEK